MAYLWNGLRAYAAPVAVGYCGVARFVGEFVYAFYRLSSSSLAFLYPLSHHFGFGPSAVSE